MSLDIREIAGITPLKLSCASNFLVHPLSLKGGRAIAIISSFILRVKRTLSDRRSRDKRVRVGRVKCNRESHSVCKVRRIRGAVSRDRARAAERRKGDQGERERGTVGGREKREWEVKERGIRGQKE